MAATVILRVKRSHMFHLIIPLLFTTVTHPIGYCNESSLHDNGYSVTTLGCLQSVNLTLGNKASQGFAGTALPNADRAVVKIVYMFMVFLSLESSYRTECHV